MLYYPKIPDTRDCPGGRCVAFEKLDGTNVHFDYHRDFGWHAFGTRRDSFNLSDNGERRFIEVHPGLEGAISAFREIAMPLKIALGEHYAKHEEVRVFVEVFGPRSFAGEHHPDDKKVAVLFDVELLGHGFVGPGDFVRVFSANTDLTTARVLFRGPFSGRLTEDVRTGKYGAGIEGVVIKGNTGWRAKVKTDAYKARLVAAFGNTWQDRWE